MIQGWYSDLHLSILSVLSCFLVLCQWPASQVKFIPKPDPSPRTVSLWDPYATHVRGDGPRNKPIPKSSPRWYSTWTQRDWGTISFFILLLHLVEPHHVLKVAGALSAGAWSRRAWTGAEGCVSSQLSCHQESWRAKVVNKMSEGRRRPVRSAAALCNPHTRIFHEEGQGRRRQSNTKTNFSLFLYKSFTTPTHFPHI